MSGGPAERSTRCPECNGGAIAVIPENSAIVRDEDSADGKVWVNCHDCGEQFLVYYKIEG